MILKIAVVGTGYVGLSLATLLSQYNEVVALDIIKDKVDMINNRMSPIKDEYIEKYFKSKKLNLKATLSDYEAFKGADYIIICMPTNYNEENNFFDTTLVFYIISFFTIFNSYPNTSSILENNLIVG